MNNSRGGQKSPGEFRTTQNWIGGSRPGNARFVPPPPERLMETLGAFEKFLHNASAKLQGINLVISGHITLSYRKSIPPNVQFKRSLSEVMEFLSML